LNETSNYGKKTFDYEGYWLDISFVWNTTRKNSLGAWQIESLEIVWASEAGSNFPINLILNMSNFEYVNLVKSFENQLRKEAKENCSD
jgi:hypothetical protein